MFTCLINETEIFPSRAFIYINEESVPLFALTQLITLITRFINKLYISGGGGIHHFGLFFMFMLF